MAINSKIHLRDVATLNTIGSGATEIWSYTLPDDCTAFLTWRVHMRDEATPQHGISFGNQTWYRSNTGVATQFGGGSANTITRFTFNGIVTEGESSNDIQLFVDGEGDDCEWVAFIELTLVEAN